MSKTSTSISYRIVSTCLTVFLAISCTASPQTGVNTSDLTPPNVVNDSSFSLNSVSGEPILLEKPSEKRIGYLPETELPEPYENWESFYKDFFEGNLKSPEEGFSTKTFKPGAHYTIQSLTGSAQLGPGPFKVKDEGYVFNIPKTFSLKTMASTNSPHTFIQVKNGYTADTNKRITNHVTIALKAAREKDIGDPKYAVRSWLQRDFKETSKARMELHLQPFQMQPKIRLTVFLMLTTEKQQARHLVI